MESYFMESVAVNRLIRKNDRMYQNDTEFEQLLNSISEYGIIEPLVVRRQADGQYRLIAGSRRLAAAEKLGFEEVDCVVREIDDPVSDSELALTENVNRLSMHPLDEAAAFARMAENGTAVEEIAKYYARSTSAIYKRIRLNGLTEELKGMFRDGKINISGAAILAGLPEKDQGAFAKKYAGHGEDSEIDVYRVEEFVHKAQHCQISALLGEECAGCGKRTHNEDPGLFEEFGYLKDVCLDSVCYGRKWHDLIAGAMEGAVAGTGNGTDKVYFGYGVPDFLYRKADAVEFSGERYTVLSGGDFRFTGETKRKNNACWEIRAGNQGIVISRVGYEKKNRDAGKKADPLEKYGGEMLKDAAADMGVDPEAVTEKIDKKYTHGSGFESAVKEKMFDRIVEMRLGGKELRNYAEIYFIYRFTDDGIPFGDDDDADLFKKITGKRWITDMTLPAGTQTLFHFFLLEVLDSWQVTTPEEIEKGEHETDIFFAYAGLDEEAYLKEYRAAMREAIEELDGTTTADGDFGE
jgi:ParB/RepB/Spo0J family partition protein